MDSLMIMETHAVFMTLASCIQHDCSFLRRRRRSMSWTSGWWNLPSCFATC